MSYLQKLRSEEMPPAMVENRDVFASPSQLAAMSLINLAGCRIIHADGVDQIGIWEDVDGPELRAALRTVNMQNVPVVHLGPGVPMRYRVRVSVERKPGESFAQWRNRAIGATK